MGHKFFVTTIKGRGRIRKIKQFGVLSPKLLSHSSASARDPNTEGNANASEKEDLPRVKEPLKKVAYQLNSRSISAMPRSGPQVFEDWCNRRTTQFVLAREDAKVGAVRICSVHGGNIMASGGEPTGVVLSPCPMMI